MELEDTVDTSDPSLKTIKGSIPELTRPARDLKAKLHAQNRKPQGRKQKNEPRAAKYHNWLTPFCWTHIVIIANHVGWQMNATDMANGLRRRDPVTFAKINRNTIEGWIERPKGGRPRWKESVLHRIENGNSPGHNKGGSKGILVR
jgi:hypothetical protein